MSKLNDYVGRFNVVSGRSEFTTSDKDTINARANAMLDSIGYSDSRDGINFKYLVAACYGYSPDDTVKYMADGYVSLSKKDLRFGNIKKNDIANGPGIRISLFVTGCHFHCKGCFNSEIWDRDSGFPVTDSVMLNVYAGLAKSQYEGISILGGEPMEPYNIAGVYDITRDVKMIFGGKKSVWVYTGYQWDNLQVYAKGGYLDYIDVIVDGQFIEEEKDPSLQFRGSSNQRVIDVQKSLKAGEVILWEGVR